MFINFGVGLCSNCDRGSKTLWSLINTYQYNVSASPHKKSLRLLGSRTFHHVNGKRMLSGSFIALATMSAPKSSSVRVKHRPRGTGCNMGDTSNLQAISPCGTWMYCLRGVAWPRRDQTSKKAIGFVAKRPQHKQPRQSLWSIKAPPLHLGRCAEPQ